MSVKVLLVAICLSVFLSSCGTMYGTYPGYFNDPDDENNTLVYGFCDIKAMGDTAGYNYIYLLPIEYDFQIVKSGFPPRDSVVVDGMSLIDVNRYRSFLNDNRSVFIYTNLPLGEYYIASIVNKQAYRTYTLLMKKPEPGDGIIVKPGGVVYAGSYELIRKGDGFYLEDSEFSFDEVVDGLKERVEDTSWEDIVNSEL